MESAISIKGQATIPKEVRDYLRVGPGDRIRFFIHPDGSVVILPKLPVTALKGLLRSEGHTSTLEEMDEAIAEGIVERYTRTRL